MKQFLVSGQLNESYHDFCVEVQDHLQNYNNVHNRSSLIRLNSYIGDKKLKHHIVIMIFTIHHLCERDPQV